MNALWPRLTAALATVDFEKLDPSAGPQDSHPLQSFAAVGGQRATEVEVRLLRNALEDMARGFGYPAAASDAGRVGFDRAAAPLIREHMDLTYAEAASRDVWSFLALVALPHLTLWRFNDRTRERWVAVDLTRHTWARLWWHAEVFAADLELLGRLSEGDLNQILERRSIGGDFGLAQGVARTVVNLGLDPKDQRVVLRQLTRRLRRVLAFVDARAMDQGEVVSLCQRLLKAQ